ncbi:metallophosphoesterase family protein [Paenibacillus chibensis]|uniref:metallophosphoesterase family protein n=1 Tax=Paenibacillus chibensis TaxID=59846 RepID=UPI000FD7ADC2|nr:metallophosphoesterase [Paenibacillus chibensis]MEC0370304.1 metallophosphoesterase [Paenibacillus chibensis]
MKLALIGDLHYHEIDTAIPGLAEARSAFYSNVLQQFMSLDADLYISMGDLTNYGLNSELKEVYELLGQPGKRFIHVLGNHDLYAQPRQNVLETTGQQRYHMLETDEAMLVFLDTAKEMDYTDWGGWLDFEQLEWLDTKVVQSGTKPLLVFGHHPVYRTTAGSDRDMGSIHPTINIWNILNRNQGIGIYFTGHIHMDSIVQQMDWSFVQMSACLDQPGFRLVDIGEECIRITAVDVTDPRVLDSAPVLHQHMKHFSPTPHARGKEKDRELLLQKLEKPVIS